MPHAARGHEPDRPIDLTHRELEIVRLVADGLSSREVAKKLCRSPRTIENHLRSVYQKLGIRNRVELVRVASDLGLLAGSPAQGAPTSELELKGRTLDMITGLDRRLARASHSDYFATLAVGLCDVLGVRWAGMTEPVPHEDLLDIIVLADSGRLQEQGQCQASVSACGRVLDTGIEVHGSGALEVFPDWDVGRAIGVEAYIGRRLEDASGRPIGTLWVMHDRPIERVDEIELILRLFGRRTAAELALAQLMDRLGEAAPRPESVAKTQA